MLKSIGVLRAVIIQDLFALPFDGVRILLKRKNMSTPMIIAVGIHVTSAHIPYTSLSRTTLPTTAEFGTGEGDGFAMKGDQKDLHNTKYGPYNVIKSNFLS